MDLPIKYIPYTVYILDVPTFTLLYLTYYVVVSVLARGAWRHED